jgi:hypothetical protein
MGLLFIHIIKSSLCLIAFYFSYKLLLSKETFYKANRFILISIILVSVLIPFFELTIQSPVVGAVPVRVKTIEGILLQKHVSVNVFAAGGPDILYSLLFFVYLGGVIIQLVITAINFIKITRITTRATPIPYADYTLALTEHDQSPFSWGKYIVLSKKEYESNPEIVIQHELVHLQKRHSLDLLLAELAVVVFWFNPVIWLLKSELKDTHEFEVDHTLLGMGVDAKQYQLLLIKKAVGERVYSIANSFNQSKLSIRIRMMLRQESSPWAMLKYVCILALTFFSVIVFAKPGITEKIKAMTPHQLGTLLKTGAARLIQAGSPKNPGQPSVSVVKTGKKAPQAALIPAGDKSKPDVTERPSEKGQAGNAAVTTGLNSPLCFVNGIQTSYEEFQQIDPVSIKTVTVMKEKEAIDAYGDKGRNGAILITLVENRKPGDILENSVYNSLAMNNPLFVFFVDGKPLGEEEQAIFAKQFNSIVNNPTLRESLIMITGKEAIRKYGDKGINGVMEIYLKK